MRPAFSPRPGPLALALLSLTACKFGWSDTGDEDDGPVEARSYDFAAGTLLLDSRGDNAVMTTSEGIVLFDTWTGEAGATTPADDFADPSLEDWLGEKVAIVDRSVDAGVFLWEPGTMGYEQRVDEEASANASTARSFGDSLAWIGRRAENCRVLRDGMDTVGIDDCGYIRDMDAKDDGTLFLGYDDDAGGRSVLRIDPDGTTTSLDLPMWRFSWDGVRQVLFTTSEGSNTLDAVTAEGGPVFSTQLPGTIVDVLSLEAPGLVAVLALEGADAYVHFVDQYSGLEVANMGAASSATFLAGSGDDSTLALVQPDRLVVATIDWQALLASFADTGA
jgi:hypothetical protein